MPPVDNKYQKQMSELVVMLVEVLVVVEMVVLATDDEKNSYLRTAMMIYKTCLLLSTIDETAVSRRQLLD